MAVGQLAGDPNSVEPGQSYQRTISNVLTGN